MARSDTTLGGMRPPQTTAGDTHPVLQASAPVQLDSLLSFPTALSRQRQAKQQLVSGKNSTHLYTNCKKCFYKLFSIKRTEIICN